MVRGSGNKVKDEKMVLSVRTSNLVLHIDNISN